MQLRVGDTPYTTLGGKTAHVRVELIAQPGVTEVRSWARTNASQWKRAASAEGDK